jgi:hypothetical protein
VLLVKCGQAVWIATASAKTPRQVRPTTRATFKVLESTVGTVFLRAVEALERLPDVVQRYGFYRAEKPSQPGLLLDGRGVRGP